MSRWLLLALLLTTCAHREQIEISTACTPVPEREGSRWLRCDTFDGVPCCLFTGGGYATTLCRFRGCFGEWSVFDRRAAREFDDTRSGH